MSSQLMFKLAVLSAVLCVCLVSTQQVKYLPCKGVAQDSTIGKVVITPCPQLPCQLKRGTNVTLSIDFKLNSNATEVTAATTVVHGIIAGVPLPFPTNYTDACATTGLKCPLKAGGAYTYTAGLFVSKSYPQVNLYVKWELQDQTKKDNFCFEVPAMVV